MTKQLSYIEIINKLEECNIHYKGDENPRGNIKYQLASANAIIERGFYYLDKAYYHYATNIKSSIIITNVENCDLGENNVFIVVANPQAAYYKIASSFGKQKLIGIHDTAIVSANAIISESAYIGPYCIIDDAVIDDGVQLYNNVIIRDNVHIKKNTIIEANSTVGARGMAWIWDDDGNRIMLPQIGGVIVGEDCVIGTDISIARGSLNENTQLGKCCVLSHGTKIGHGSILHDYVSCANNVTLAGNVNIGSRTFLGSGSTVFSNISVASNCIVGAAAAVNKAFMDEYVTIAGVPAKIIKRNNYLDKPSGAPKPFKN